MKKIVNRYQVFIYLSFFLLAGLFVTLINLGIKKDYLGDDIGFSYYFSDVLSKLSSTTWDGFVAPGKLNVTALFSIVWYYPLYWLSLLHINGWLLGRLLLFFFLFVSGSGMFFLAKYLISKNTDSSTKILLINNGAFIAGLFYMFNQYSLQMVTFPIMPYHLTYILFPWLFLVFLVSINSKLSIVKIILFGFLLLLFSAGNPSNTISVFVFIIFYILFFSHNINLKNSLLFLLTSLMLTILLSAYIWLPLFSVGSNPYGLAKPNNNFLGSLIFNSTITKVNNLFRLIGSVALQDLPYYIILNNKLMIFISYLLPISILLVLVKVIKTKLGLFLAIVISTSIFFAKGTQPPFANIFIFLFEKVPFFEMYRSVYLKFAFFSVFAYSLLLGWGYCIYFSKQRRILTQIVLLFTVIFICISSFPFFIGSAIKKEYLTKIPQEYFELKNITEDDGKILSLPPAPQGSGLLLDWGSNNRYNGPHQDYLFFNRPVFDSYWFTQNSFINLTKDDSWDGNRFEKQINLLLNKFGAFNIRYLFLHKDLSDGYYANNILVKKIDNDLKTNTIIKQLQSNDLVSLIKKAKHYNLYKISDQIYLPQIYIPSQIFFSNNPIKTLLNNPKIVITKQSPIAILPSSGKYQKIVTIRPSINKQTVKGNQYQIKVDNVQNDFFLVFSETYNSNWRLTSGSILINKHIVTNGYSNGWWVSPKQLCPQQNEGENCSGELTLSFFPQTLFSIGKTISLSTLCLCLIILIFSLIKKKFYVSNDKK